MRHPTRARAFQWTGRSVNARARTAGFSRNLSLLFFHLQHDALRQCLKRRVVYAGVKLNQHVSITYLWPAFVENDFHVENGSKGLKCNKKGERLTLNTRTKYLPTAYLLTNSDYAQRQLLDHSGIPAQKPTPNSCQGQDCVIYQLHRNYP